MKPSLKDVARLTIALSGCFAAASAYSAPKDTIVFKYTSCDSTCIQATINVKIDVKNKRYYWLTGGWHDFGASVPGNDRGVSTISSGSLAGNTFIHEWNATSPFLDSVDKSKWVTELRFDAEGRCIGGSVVGDLKRTGGRHGGVSRHWTGIKVSCVGALQGSSAQPDSPVGHLQDAEPEAQSLLTRARAAEAYCNRSSQMKASDNYYAAARLFERQGDKAGQARAEAAGSAASHRADECEKPRGKTPPPSDKNKDKCEWARKQADALRAAGGDVAKLRADLKPLGCAI